MSWTKELPSKLGWYAWRQHEGYRVFLLIVEMPPPSVVKPEPGTWLEGHWMTFDRMGGEWLRLVPADELTKTWDEAWKEADGDPYDSVTAWCGSRAKRIHDGETL